MKKSKHVDASKLDTSTSDNSGDINKIEKQLLKTQLGTVDTTPTKTVFVKYLLEDYDFYRPLRKNNIDQEDKQ